MFIYMCVQVEHALAGGRIANGCRAVSPFHAVAVASGQGGVLTPPITLPTPGKVRGSHCLPAPYSLPTTHYSLLTYHYSVPTTHYSPLTTN